MNLIGKSRIAEPSEVPLGFGLSLVIPPPICHWPPQQFCNLLRQQGGFNLNHGVLGFQANPSITQSSNYGYLGWDVPSWKLKGCMIQHVNLYLYSQKKQHGHKMGLYKFKQVLLPFMLNCNFFCFLVLAFARENGENKWPPQSCRATGWSG